MKRILLATALLASPAFGADLYQKAPPATVSYDAFSGFYLGAHLGYGWNNATGRASTTDVVMDFKDAPQGFVGGIHGGFGGRFSSIWYLGIEADADLATIDGSLGSPGFVLNTNSKNRWLGSVRGRFGIIPVGHAMIYGTVGYGVGSSEFTLSALNTTVVSASPTQSGLVAGGGIEVPLAANWLARAEYLHYAFGDINANVGAVAIKVQDRVDVARAGLSYKF